MEVNQDKLLQQCAPQVFFDPFSATEEQIKAYDAEVVFRLSRSGASLRAFVPHKSRAKRMLRRLAGVHYIRAERCYFFPVSQLNDFLKMLRDKKVRFVVAKTAGEVLLRGVEERSSALKQGSYVSKEMLRRGLLCPYVAMLSQKRDKAEKMCFALCEYTTEQLRQSFSPHESIAEKKKKASSLSENDLLGLLFQLRGGSLRVWLSKEVVDYLESRRGFYKELIQNRPRGFANVLLAAVTPSPCWFVSPEGRPSLIIAPGQVKLFAEVLGSKFPREVGILLRKREQPSECVSNIDISNINLVEFYKEASKLLSEQGCINVPESNLFISLIAKIEAQHRLLCRQKEIQSLRDTSIPEMEDELEHKLFPHQRVAVSWLINETRAFLGDDMGLGKTLSVLATFHVLRKTDKADFLLVVCPNSLTRNWQREAQTWIPELKLLTLPEAKKKRSVFFDKLKTMPLDWIRGLVVNYETMRLKDVFPEIRALCDSRRTMLCLDESQRAKNHRSQTFQALRTIAPVCRRRVLLSGTPTPKDISDIWSQIFLLDEGERFGTNYYHWLETVAELGTKWSQFAVKRFLPEGVEEAISRVQELLLRRRKEEVIDLPEKIFSVRDVPLCGDQKKRYNEVCKELQVRIGTTTGASYYKEIDNILEEFLRAVQIASNPRLVDESWRGEPAKYLELDEIVREIVVERGKKLVVWTNFRRNVDELVGRYSKLGAAGFFGDTPTEKRQQIVEDFQEKHGSLVKILIAIPAAGGVGITLTEAQTAVYLDKTWNGEHWMQSVDRIHRIGQKGTVNVISLHGCFIDELISANVRKKEKAQARLLGDATRGNSVLGVELYPSREELMESVNAVQHEG